MKVIKLKVTEKTFHQQVIKQFAKLKFIELLLIAYGILGTYYVGKWFSNLCVKLNHNATPPTSTIELWAFGWLANLIILFVAGALYLWVMKNWEWAEKIVTEQNKVKK